MKKLLRCSFFILALSLWPLGVQAKDLTHRLGLGFKNNTSQSIPSLAAVYYYSKELAFTGGVGLDTRKNNSAMQINAGARKMIYFENNLNFYVGGQLGLINYETPADGKNTGFEVLGLFGAEFFFAGLENLGFTAEAGVGLSTAKETRLRTTADDPLRAGIVFYF